MSLVSEQRNYEKTEKHVHFTSLNLTNYLFDMCLIILILVSYTIFLS